MNTNSKYMFIFGLVLAIFIALFERDIFYLFAIILVLSIMYFVGRNLVLLIIIVSQITFTGQNLIAFRPYLSGASILILLYYFVKEFGFDLKNYPKVPKVVLYFFVFAIATLFISTISSIDIVTSFVTLLRTLVFFLFCYLLYALIDGYKTIIYMILSLFIGLMIIGITMLYEFFQKGASFFIDEGALLRLAGIYENPNYVGLLLLVTIPITISYLMIYKNLKKNQLFFILLVLLIQLSLLMLADSRSSFLSVMISSIIIFLYSSNKSRVIVGAVVSLSFLAILFLTDVSFLVDIFLRPERIGTRDLFWQSGVEIVKNNYILGTGPGTFEKIFYVNASSVIVDLIQSTTSAGGTPHPHNLFLYFWAENGILGLITVISFFYIFFYLIFRVKNHLTNSNDHTFPLIISVFGIFLGVLVRSFFEITGVITYGFITRDLPLWIILIVLIYFYQGIDEKTCQS